VLRRLHNYVRDEGAIGVFGLFFWLVSVLLIPAAFACGLHWSKTGARGYFQKPNWFLYPAFIPVLLWLVHITWYDYVDGWKSIRDQGVLHTNEFRYASADHLAAILRFLRRSRPALFISACVLGLILTTIDSHSAYSLIGKLPSEIAGKCVDRDFFIASVLKDTYFPRASWTGTIWFGTWCYLMQGALIALSFTCLLQILFHGSLFTFFEGTGLARQNRLSISLRANDPASEFGLERWNYAINRGYVFVAFAMLVPLISHWSQIGGGCENSVGQRMFALLLWLILLGPILLPLLARFARRKEVTALVIKADDRDFKKEIDEQRLWPFDKDNIGKIALSVSFVEYLLIANVMHTDKVVEWVLKAL
jgi:hypothetical protein